MTNRAAIRWVTRGLKAPVIQYMLLNSELEYLIYPREQVVTNLKEDLNRILNELEQRSAHQGLDVYYKSINKNYGRHRKDSAQFHLRIKQLLAKKKLLQANSRLASLLKKDQLRLFKDALFLLDIDCKTRGNAFITHLWAIALKATRSRVPLVIKQIWKARFSIRRMNPIHEKNFQEFYAHLL